MRDGLRLSVALNEFVVAAVCVTVIACTVGYLYSHMPRPAAPALVQDACGVKEPTITIEQTFFIPVPAPKVKVVVLPPPKKEYFGEDDGDVSAPDKSVKPETQPDPVFEHRTPVVTSALQQPMPK